MATQATTFNRIREARLDRGLELYDLAALLRRTTSTCRRYEEGTQAVPTKVWTQLASEWDLTVDWLMGRPGAVKVPVNRDNEPPRDATQ